MVITGFSRFPAALAATVFMVSMFGPTAIGAPARAEEPPSLGLPIQCHMGKNCWLVNLVDLDPGLGRRDYGCGQNTYNGHKGVDIAIRDRAAMDQGFPVVAAAPGVVKGMRDGMADRVPDKAFRETKKNLYCGNGVVIDHGGGWETQYCHLRRGSVVVKSGDKVGRAQKIGLVGNSGMADFPHVHLSVRHLGRVIDPFLGLETPADRPPAGCGATKATVWTEAAQRVLRHTTTALFNAGFAAEAPKARAIRNGLYHATALSRRSPVLVFWAESWWVRAGDRMEIKIVGPGGETIVEHANTLKKDQALRMVFAGKKKPGLFWPAGTYIGIARLSRTEAGETRHFEARRDVHMRE